MTTVTHAPLAARLTRAPRPFEPKRGREAVALFPGLVPELAELVAGTAGCSPYLAALLHRERDWAAAALEQSPEDAFETVMAEAAGLGDGELPSGLRQAKRRVALLVALADLGGAWRLEEVTHALTRFADLSVDMSLKAAIAPDLARGRLPGMGPEDRATAAGMVALAMGKMGAFELNYSSDIDLICLFDNDRFAPEDVAEARAVFVRATRRMTATLSEQTAEGYVWRTDLRLRPDAAVTPVCLSMDAAEAYYESEGRTWERAAYIKARAAAGDIAAGERFLERLRPFVWRRHLDFAAIRDAHDIRLRIREHKGLGGLPGPEALEGTDIKLGRGGIREIEFFTQTRQLIAGGRDPDLRVRGTVEGLERLAQKGWIPADVAETLTADYRAHRELEHRLQMIADAQTQKLPGTAEAFARLAAFMDRDEGQLRQEIAERLARVHELTEGFFAPGAGDRGAEAPELVLEEHEQEIVDGWRRYPALRSARAREIFDRLLPEILRRLDRAANRHEALMALDGFLAGLPAGVQLFSLFEANPHLIDLVVDIAGISPELARYLSRNAGVFDAVLGGDFFADWPGREALAAALAARLAEAGDYEARLDAARAWAKEWHFRIGVHLLRGLIDAETSGRQYADLADAVLTALWPVVVEEFSTRHGPPPGQGAAVIGMGSLGARRLNAASDLDLIVIYEPGGQEASTGRRPLATRSYYARLTQAFVTALSAPTAEGRLYEVDMRLRPSGRQGPVAVSFAGFCDYQRNEAWTWEHLALTRARPVAGEAALGQAVEAFRRQLLAAPRDAVATLRDVREMRARLAAERPGEGVWDPKLGPGRLLDIGLCAQTGALLAGDPARDAPEQIAAARRFGWLGEEEAQTLLEAHALFWSLQAGVRLMGASRLDWERLGAGGQAFLLRLAGAADAAELAARVARRGEAAAEVIGAALERVPGA
jgi:glutamate-ammonia-ligase adenylyltransferase